VGWFNRRAVKERQERKGFPLGQEKTESKRGRLGPGRRPAILLAAAALIALAIPAVADAKKKGKGGQKVTVMTRNVFLGADLGPALEASDIPSAIDGAGQIWNEFQSTKFPERAVPLAREIKESKADLVGLQEVATWFKQTPSDGGAPPISPIAGATPATDVEQDFLALLEQELKNVGAKYKVVRVQEEFSGELPVDADQNDATGTGPLAVFGADFDARLLMHDVILARKGSKVKLGATNAGHFTTRFEPSISGVEIPVDRGWVSVEAKVKGKSGTKGKKAASKKKAKTSKFRFVDTHLEAFGDPTIREAQAKELIAGPLNTNKQTILVGDLNSGLPDPHNVGNLPGQDPNDPLAFQAFRDAGFKDNGAVQTCCYPDLFDGSLVFDHTVDHVLTRPGLKTKKAFVTGNDAAERTPSGLWPSDHGGLVVRLQLKK
jgi:endonuclease/exonuclease/phosphatase family metal-dependent hydrolase